MVSTDRSKPTSAKAGRTTPENSTALIRTRLTELTWREPILLIEAPAGYGKSVLTRQLLKATPRTTATMHLALGDEHRDPGVLLADLLRLLFERDGVLVNASDDPVDLFPRLVSRLESASRRFRLFFDDVHRLAESASMPYLNRLLGGAGPALQFVLASRDFSDPELSIADLSGRGMVRWLGTADLALTQEEAQRLVRLRGLHWSSEQISALVRVTQGWPVLLQLALSGGALQLDESRLGGVAGSAPVRRYIEDRFLSALNNAQCRLLAIMACDDAFPMPLLDALEIAAPQSALTSLEGLGILQRLHLSNGMEAFNIHPILRESVLRSASPEVVERLKRLRKQAAEWWHERGDIRRAVKLMVAADDRQQASQWLLYVAENMVFRGGHHQTFLDLLSVCQPVPPSLANALEQFAVWALIFQRRHNEAETRLQSTKAITSAAQGEVILQRAVIAAMRDDYQSAASFAGDWLKNYDGDSFHQGAARVVLAFNQKCESQFDEASQNLDLARKQFALIQSNYGLAWAHVVSLLVLLKTGRHRQARAEIATSLDAMAGEDGPASQRAMLLGMQALLCYERNDLAEARMALDDCLALLPDQGLVDAVICGYIAAARLRCAEGDLGTALDLLAEGENMGKQRGFPRLSMAIAAERVMSLIRVGAIEQAESAAYMAGLVPDSATAFEQDRGGRLFARLALLRGEPRRALELMRPMVSHAQETGQKFKLCECLLLQAIASYDMADKKGALDLLQQALRLGELEGYFRIYYDELPLLSPLLELYNAEYGPRRSPIVKHVLEASLAKDAVRVPVAFSKREVQIMHLLAEGLSNSEIAARCFLGAGTVKWHLHNIYGKLDVGSRTAAVHAAQRLGVV